MCLGGESRLTVVLERALLTVGPERLEDAMYRWYTEPGMPEPRFDPDGALTALSRLPARAELAPGGVAARLLDAGLSRNPKKVVPGLLMKLAPLAEAARAGASIFEVLLDLWDWADEPAPSSMTALSYVSHHVGRSKSRPLKPLARLLDQLRAAAGSPLSVLVTELLPRVVLRIAGHKAEHGQFDFDDMLRMLRDALYATGGDALCRELSARYRVALVDEFQDTDRVQWDIFRRLFVEGPGSLVVIGDPKQAIYGFRNADVHTYHEARRAIVARGGSRVPLTVNYRSRRTVVDALNRVFAASFFTGVNRYEHPVTCGRMELDAHDPDGRSVSPVTLLHFVGRPTLRAAAVRRALAERIAEEIGQLLHGGLRIVGEEPGPREVLPSDIQVLCRSRGDAVAVASALTAARLPFALYKQEGLFQTEAARHVWELLRAIEDPRDSVRRLHAWLTPFFGVPLGSLAASRELGPDHPLTALLAHWRSLAERQRWAALFRSLLEDSGLSRRELFLGLGERDLTDYVHLLELLLEEVHRGHRSLSQLRGRLAAFIDGRELPVSDGANVHRVPSEEAAVQVLTMHKSKGLEADVVFLAGGFSEPSGDHLGPRVFHDEQGQRVAWMGETTPEVDERMRRERREEAERLLYVSLTRARAKLYLPYFGSPPAGTELLERASFELEAEPDKTEVAQLSLLYEEPETASSAPVSEAPELKMRGLSGPYRVLNDRLCELVEQGAASGESPSFEHAVVEVSAHPSRPRDAGAPRTSWSPPPSLEVTALDDPRGWVEGARAGFEVTSYSGMKRARGGSSERRAHTAEADEREHRLDMVDHTLLAPALEELGAEVEGSTPGDTSAALPELPGGTATGVFLHEVLEHLPFEEIEELPKAEDEALRPAHRALFERCARQNGVDLAHVPAAVALIRGSMSVPVTLADGSTLSDGLRSLEHRAAELPFVHPIPEVWHPRLDEPPPGPDRQPVRIERGFIRGVIDLVFEHRGRYHVLDYKSDRLVDYAEPAVRAHVEASYEVQARLYTLGALRALTIHDQATYEERFGGLIYAFLRGMCAGTEQGVYVVRPTWTEVLEWERALLGERPWGYPLPLRA